MKKCVIFLLILLTLCTIIACGQSGNAAPQDTRAANEAASDSQGTITQDQDTATPEPTEEPTPAPTEPPEVIVLVQGEMSLFPGEKTEWKATGVASIQWSSSDPAVATVDEQGVITALAAGQTTITACSAKDDSVKATGVITVGDHVQSVVLEETELMLLTGSEKANHTLSPQVLPETALVKEVNYTSSDEAILTVNEQGQIHAVAPGTVTIIITAADETNGASTQCEVTVKQGVSSIELNTTAAELYPNEKLNLTAKVYPEDAEDKRYIWTSSDETIAAVTEKGAVSAKGVGKAVIRCTAQDGSEIYGQCEVDVVIAAKRITVDPTKATLLVGASEDLQKVLLNYTVSPDDTSFKDVVWTSSDESIATVDANGLVKGVSAGRATITATTTDSRAAKRVKATCTVTVGYAITGITLEGGDSRIQKNKSVRFTAKVNPEKPFNGKLAWSSSNENILKVDANGNVRAVNVGTAEITVKATDGSNVSAKKRITVYQPVTQIKPETKKVAVTEGKNVTLSVSVLPTDATDKKINWSSSASYIASVDSNGIVTGKTAGTCDITATAADGSGKSVKITVVVEPKIPLDATKFTRSGYFGAYYEFAVTFKNLTKTRTIKYISFDLKYTYQGKTYTLYSCYTDRDTLKPGNSKRIGWWDNIGYRLSYCSNFRVYLRSVKYSDGTWEFFDSESTLLGWFN